MRFLKGHIFIVLTVMLLSIFSTGVLADDFNDVNCIEYSGKPDVRCKYARIWSTRAAQLYVVHPDSAIIKKNAEKNKEFLIYIPKEVDSDTLKVYLADDPDSAAVHSGIPVTSSADSGLVNLRVYSRYEYKNFRIGTTMSASDPDPLVNLVYSFYVPVLEYSVKGEVVTDMTKIGVEVGDTVRVDVRAVIPFGPQKDRTDSTLKKTYFFSSFGESKNLRFLNTSGDTLIQSNGMVRLEIDNGVGAFKIVATKAVTDGSTFTLSGFEDGKDKNDNIKFIANDKFPGELQFVNPDMPSLDKAAIYDTDGDGIGDSIATWFGGNMDSISVEKFFYSWPDKESFKAYVGDVNGRGDVYGLPDVQVDLQQDSASGAVKAYVCSTLGSRCDTLTTSLQDSIGAAIQSASLVRGNDGKDVLVVRFNKEIDTTWSSGWGLKVNGNAIDVDAISKEGKVWRFEVDANTVSVGEMVRIETGCTSKCPDGIITAADGVPTARNNQEVPITDAGQHYLSNKNNGFYDRNGDGRMDSASVGFEMPITTADLKNLELRFYWLDQDGDLVEIIPNVKDLVISDDGLVVGYPLDPEKYNVKKMLTAIDKSYSNDGNVEYGYAKMFNKVTIDGKDSIREVQAVMNDSMPPVISSTFLNPESFQEMEPDKFRISFSEPIDYDGLQVESDWLVFYVDGKWVSYDLNDAVWSDDGCSVTILMEAGESLTGRMNPADSVRFENFTSGLKDRHGNKVSEKSPAVMVMGDPRVVMQTTPMADLTRAEELSDRVKPFTIDHVESELSEEQKASLGVLMDVGFSTIMSKDSSGAYVADVKKIGLKWELFVYTNLGTYVGSASGRIDCDDSFFDGNCLENADKLYLRWNMRSDSGRKVGVGVYLAKFNVKVFGAEEDFKVERVFRWGVTATRR